VSLASASRHSGREPGGRLTFPPGIRQARPLDNDTYDLRDQVLSRASGHHLATGA
jgi:hypothetical protein